MRKILWLFPVVVLGWLWKRLLKKRHQEFLEVDIETPEDLEIQEREMDDEEI